MSRNLDASLDRRAQEVAYLTAQHRMSQAEIGRLYKISQSQVSRLLTRAKEKNWLEVEYRFLSAEIPPERIAEIHRILEPQDITKALKEVKPENGVQVHRVWVFESGSNDPSNIETRLKRFGRNAAGALSELLTETKVIAVSYGSTLHSLIEGLAVSRLRLRSASLIDFVPVTGEPVGRDTTNDPLASFTSSRLADRLNEIVNDGKGKRYTLAGVRAFIPKKFKGKEAEAIRKYLESGGSYKKIFKDRSPAISQADALLTSIGTSEKPMGFCNAELLEDGRVDAKTLGSLIEGDMAGVLISKPDLPPRDHKKVEELNQMWTGIEIGHIKRIAEAAARGEKAGVIVVAIGRNKAHALHQMIRLGLVNTLILDKDLLSALRSRLHSES